VPGEQAGPDIPQPDTVRIDEVRAIGGDGAEQAAALAVPAFGETGQAARQVGVGIGDQRGPPVQPGPQRRERTGRAQRLAVLHLDVGSIATMRFDRGGVVVSVDGQLRRAEPDLRAEPVQCEVDQRPAADRAERLRSQRGERPKPGACPGRERDTGHKRATGR
jgi:hypothetical protein